MIPNIFNRKYTISVLLVILTALALYNMLALRFIVDDAYITMRYSRHLAEGHGPVYNIGEPVEGYTDFLWMLMLSGAYKAGFDMPLSSQALGISFSMLTLLMVFFFSLRFAGSMQYLPLLPVCLLASNRTFSLWATGGLETALFTFLLTLVLYLSCRLMEGKATMQRWLAGACFLLSLTRPEGLMLSFLVWGALLIYNYAHGRLCLKSNLRDWLLFFGIPCMLYLAWKLYFYHDLLPNTFYNKVNSLHYFSRGIAFLSSFIQESWTMLWILPVIAAACLCRAQVWVVVWTFILGVYVFYTVWVGGDWMDFRFYAPVLPLMALLLTRALADILSWISANAGRIQKKTSIVLLWLYILCAAAASSASIYLPERKHVLDELATRSVMNMEPRAAQEIAEALKILLRPDEVIAHSFAGFPAVYIDNRVIDILGQNDKVISRQKITERHTPGHEKGPPPGYLEQNRVIFIYPWVVEQLCGDADVYCILYRERQPIETVHGENGTIVPRKDTIRAKYLKFNSTWPREELARRFASNGFKIYYEGKMINHLWDGWRTHRGPNLDFEAGTYNGWEVSGKAFGDQPAFLGKWVNSDRIQGQQGDFFVNSFLNNSDADTGQLLSKPFKLAGDYLHFLIGGGNNPGKTCVNILVENRLVFSTTGKESETLEPVIWDIRPYRGKIARILILDDSKEGWGHVLADDFRILPQASSSRPGH